MREPNSIVCDSSSIITLAEVCLINLFSRFSEAGAVRFFIPVGVRKEVVDTPLTTKSFRFEAVKVAGVISKGHITVIDKTEMLSPIHDRANEIINLANDLFHAPGGRPIHILDYGEADAMALALEIGCMTILVDEKTTRLLIEKPSALHESLETRLGVPVSVNKRSLALLSSMLSGLSAMRSSELVAVGYARGYLDSFAGGSREAEKDLLGGALFAVKENGCSISESEIRDYVAMLAPSGERRQ